MLAEFCNRLVDEQGLNHRWRHITGEARMPPDGSPVFVDSLASQAIWRQCTLVGEIEGEAAGRWLRKWSRCSGRSVGRWRTQRSGTCWSCMGNGCGDA